MTKIEVKNLIANLIDDFHSEKKNKYKLVVFVGLLGDFDSFEYAINLNKLLNLNKNNNLDIFFIAIGNEKGKEKFCRYTGFPKNNLKIVSDNQLHNLVGASRGLNIGLEVG